MKVAVHPVKKAQYQSLDSSLRWIDTGTVEEVEIPIGKYAAEARESVLHNEADGTFSMHDDVFVVEGVQQYEQYALAGKCEKRHDRTSAQFLLVADAPFRVKHVFMVQNSETWGTLDAESDSYYSESKFVTE